MFKQISVIVVVFTLFAGCSTIRLDDEIIDLFRKLYKTDKQKHEEFRSIQNGRHNRVSQWQLSSSYPEYQVELDINRHFQAMNENSIRRGAAQKNSINNQLFDNIENTEVMKKTIDFLRRRNIRNVNLTSLWTGALNPTNDVFLETFLAEEKFALNSPFRPYIAYDNIALVYQMRKMKDVATEIHITPFVEIVKLKNTSRRKPRNFLMGLSLELEMAMYTTCFLVHPNEECEVALEDKKFYLFTAGISTRYITTVYPKMRNNGVY